MKKILITIVVCIAAVCSCSPLRIVMNTTGADGERLIVTSDQPLFSYEKGQLTAALGCQINGKDTVLALLITSDANSGHGIFAKGDKLKVRFSDDEVITLENLYDREFETHTETGTTEHMKTDWGYAYTYDPWMDSIDLTPYQITRMVPQTYTRKVSKSYALYLLTRHDIEGLMKKPVKKFRVEIEDADLDMPYTDGVNELFTSLMTCLYGGIKDKFERSEF